MNASDERKILVVYYSVTGNTARVARDIARLTGGDIESIRDKRHGVGFTGYLKSVVDAVRGTTADIGALARDPRDYRLTVIGTPVWAWHMTPAVRAYLQQCRERLGDVAFFVTSGDTDATKIVPSMAEAARHKAVAFSGFNARELANHEAYDAKLSRFVQALQSGAVSHAPAQASVALQAR